ncbi:MAG: hypothetical protein JWO38_2121 [Gemmataceae bacterium]|nr:hypothetical protein [Gemmataceae bacterium]
MSKLVRGLALSGALAGLVAACIPTVAPAQPKDKKGDVGTVEVFKDKAGDYRWRVKDADGKVIAMPPKGYDTKDDCLKALAVVKAALAKSKVTEAKEDAEAKKDK